MHTAVQVAWRRWCVASPLAKDGVLYLASAAFALITALVAKSGDYRQWGAMAGTAYGIATVACAVLWRRERRAPLRAPSPGRARRAIVVFLILGAVLAPLALELAWRATGGPGAHAQPEVAVIERAGDRAAGGHDPYLAHPTEGGVAPTSDGRAVDAASFFPYLPGMVTFGLPNALPLPGALRDARFTIAGFTLLVAAGALIAGGAPLGRRGRALQFLVVLPSGALPMVTGGDDLPVLALLLASLVLAERHRPVLAGIVAGAAGTLKLTAWPLLAVLALVVEDGDDRPASRRYLLAVASVVVPVVGAGLLVSPAAFVENVVRYPLGLTRVPSPAASPLLGQVLVHAFPAHKAPITAGLLLVGVVVVAAVFVRHRPRTPASAARFVAFAMAAATVLAPATRFGYLIYPANLVVWAYVLDGAPPRPRQPQSTSLSSSTRSNTALVGALCPLPESAGVIEGIAGSTRTPTSQ